MSYQISRIAEVAELLKARFATLATKPDILKAVELKALYAEIPTLPADQKAGFGGELNQLKQELLGLVQSYHEAAEALPPIDVTAPFDINSPRPELLPNTDGSTHPLTKEIASLSDIFARMGFEISESREIDDQYHMFETLNFPKGHPARDDYDTFMTVQADKDGDPLISPAHTSTMQNRVLAAGRDKLEQGEAIAVVIPDRVFRNEDLDARHEHTFYQVEGVYVAKGVHAGMLVATLQTFLQEYYGKDLDVRVNPFYFPFTEPSFEFGLSCPFCNKAGCNICSYEGWIELLGCGMIHPNVLQAAGIDPTVYTGFAWGCGVDRLVMMKYGIEDVRHFESAKLDFLRQFA
jgi:phenylalanyl-tRNA synthetase alpha chain